MDAIECNLENVRECVDKYLLLDKQVRILILDKYPTFKQFYFFIKGTIPETLKHDLLCNETSQFISIRRSFNSSNKIKNVDFSDPDDQYGYEGEVVFDMSQSKYFRFGEGYLSDNQIVQLFSSREDDNVELIDKVHTLELTENFDIESFDEDIDDIYRPVSPDYDLEEVRNDGNADCNGGILVNEIEAETIDEYIIGSDMKESSQTDNIVQQNINVIDPIPSGSSSNLIDLRHVLDKRKINRRKNDDLRRRQLRDNIIAERRNVNNSIILYPRGHEIMDSEDVPLEEIQMQIDDLNEAVDVAPIKIVRCIYREREIIFSSEPILRSHVTGKVFCYNGYYIAKEENLKIVSSIMAHEKVTCLLQQMRSLQSYGEIDI